MGKDAVLEFLAVPASNVTPGDSPGMNDATSGGAQLHVKFRGLAYPAIAAPIFDFVNTRENYSFNFLLVAAIFVSVHTGILT